MFPRMCPRAPSISPSQPCPMPLGMPARTSQRPRQRRYAIHSTPMFILRPMCEIVANPHMRTHTTRNPPLCRRHLLFSDAPSPIPSAVDDYTSPDGRPHDPVGPGLHRHGPPADARTLPVQGHGNASPQGGWVGDDEGMGEPYLHLLAFAIIIIFGSTFYWSDIRLCGQPG